MKKALALILTVAMLLSCLTVGISAARVVTVTEVEAQYDKAWLASGENWNANGFESYAGSSFTYELKIYSDPDSNNGGLSEYNPTMNFGPEISMKNGKVGYGDVWVAGKHYLLDYTFAANTWYTVRYEVDGNTTEIYINDEYVGTLEEDNAMRAVVANTNYGTYVSEVKITEGGEVKFHDTCDAVPADATGGSVEKLEVVAGSVDIKNENVISSKDKAWLASGENWNANGFESYAGSEFTYELKIYSDPDSNNGGLSEYNPTMNFGPEISMKNGKVGYGDVWVAGKHYLVDYTFAANTWYTVRYEVSGNTTEIYINDEYVGTLEEDNAMRAVVANTNYGTYVSEVKITEGGEVKFHDTCDALPADATGGTIESFTIEGARYDLGNYYYGMDESIGHYFYPGFSSNGSDTVAFDLMFDAFMATGGEVGAGNRTDVFITGPKLDLAADVIGVNGETVSYDFDADVWYHVEFVADGSNTAIYVDGAHVGTVAAVMGTFCFNGHGIAIDNLQVGDFFDDFEDGNLSNSGDSHSEAYEYTFELEEPADPFETMGMDKVAEGDAWLLEDRNDGYGCGYAKDYPSDVVVNGAVAYSFDLALLPNNHRGNPYSAEKDPDGSQTWFEIWRDTASKRFRVGFDTENTQFSGFAGESDSLIGFDWGEMTATNFHNVVIVFANRVGQIYIDGVKLYEGPAGQAGIGGTNTTLFAIVGGSAIIDNMAIYNVEDLKNVYAMSEGVLFSGNIENNGAWEGVKGWTVGADCAENGHVFHNIDTTTTETCYSLGYDTVYCAVCGEAYETHERAMLVHNYVKYDINRTADGLIYAYCQADGCVDKKFVTPTSEAYEGTMSVYLDMSDDMAANISFVPNPGDNTWEPNIFNNFSYENGVATVTAATYLQNYSRFNMERFANNAPKSGDWSVAFDLTFNGTWDTDDNINSKYEHYSLFMLGGNNCAFVTLNFEKDYVQIAPNTWSGSTVQTMKSDYDFVEGETYNVKFTFEQYKVLLDSFELPDGTVYEEWADAVDFYVLINNEVVIAYDYESLEGMSASMSYEKPESSFPGFYNQNFGVSYSIDNFVVATSDFDWTERTYVGDVNGDNYLDAADALAMRKFLAKVIDDSALATSRMDANGDNAINAKDQLTIRKALAA